MTERERISIFLGALFSCLHLLKSIFRHENENLDEKRRKKKFKKYY